MTPTPTPAPPMPMHAMPAPISLAAAGSIFSSLRERSDVVGNSPDSSVSRVNGVVEIYHGQDRKHVSLQERDQDFESVNGDRQSQRRNAADPADGPERDTEHGDETREHFQRDVTRQHVAEQAHAVRNRPQEKGEDFDHNDQRQN